MSRIRVASLNIMSEKAVDLEAALQALKQGNIDVGVLQETNIMDGIHARNGVGYTVCYMGAEIRHRGGIMMV